MNAKILLLSMFVFSSCRYDFTGPYKVGELTNLKSENDSLFLKNYNHYGTIYANDKSYNVQLKYDENQKNIILFNFLDQIPKDTQEKSSFILNSYFFITSEKLELLFPVNNVRASYTSLVSHSITIKKFAENENEKNRNYEKFEYVFEDGYLFLRHYYVYLDSKLSTKDIIFSY